MRIIRVFFTKTGEAAYISHLDLQRVMARALRKAQVPVWYSQGFNPHIYMSFALPLPLLHESLAETVDCKTEAEEGVDFAKYVEPLAAALPKGIDVSRIAPPVHGADAITKAEYSIAYPAEIDARVLAETYNRAGQAPVLRKTKRSEETVDLKAVLPQVECGEGNALRALLPAGSVNHYSPALLTSFLQQACEEAPAESAHVLRLRVYTAEGGEFA